MKDRITSARRINPFIRKSLSYSCSILPATGAAMLALGAMLSSNALAETVTQNTEGTLSWECPPGITSVTVECWGGGGAGGAAQYPTTGPNGNCGGGGGAGGAYARKINVPVIPGDFYDLTVGPAATAPAGSVQGARFNGETVSFTNNDGVTVTAVGGEGGESKDITSGNEAGLGGTGSSSGSDGDVGAVFAGGSGAQRLTNSGGAGGGGAGDANPGGDGSTSSNDAGTGGIAGGGDGGAGRGAKGDGNSGNSPGGGGGGAKAQYNGTSNLGGSYAGGTGGLGQITITFSPPSTGKLVVTTVPANADAGTDFSVTVQSQTSGGAPLNVTQDTDILLTASGSGTLTGNTATILNGENTATFNFVQYTTPESITLTASRTSGDGLDVSVPSSSITIDVGAASQLVVETAADGTGVPVAAQTVYSGNTLTAYAIARDSVGNFVANEPAAWSLANITGAIVSGDLVDNANGSATFTGNGFGSANIQASFGALPDADSGLITVEKFYNRWTGAGANGSWATTANWSNSVDPDFNDTTDLAFSAPTNSKGSPYIGQNYTVRSLTFDTTSTANMSISFIKAGFNDPANLTFDTDSVSEPAEINVDAAFTGIATLGYTGTTEANRGVMILNDDLLVTHNGAGNLVINGDITESGSHGLTKAGSGTLIISGTNSYTGNTVVNEGTLSVTGESIANSATLAIDGGVVNVTGNEVVAGLFFGMDSKAEGTYGSSTSDPVPGTIDDSRFSGTGIVTVMAFVSGFNTWITGDFANGTVPEGQQGPNDDPDADGISNLMEYAVAGLDPTVGEGAPGTLTGNTLSFDKRQPLATDISYSIEQSTDLGISDLWEEAPEGASYVNDGTTISYELPGGPTKDFMRLKVLQP